MYSIRYKSIVLFLCFTIILGICFPVPVQAEDPPKLKWKLVSAAHYHGQAIAEDGTLWGWGQNSVGQIGDGTTISIGKNVPVPLNAGNQWVSVACGDAHSLALKSDGTLWSWGSNDFGQLGLGDSNVEYHSPTQVGSHSDWAFIAAGEQFSAAIKTDGSLWTWGRGSSKLGLGETFPSIVNSPAQVGTDTDWKSISLGESHALAIKTDGTLWSWANDGWGQLGNSTKTDQLYSPEMVGLDRTWVQVSAGSDYSMGIKSDGSLWGWGNNEKGQLGVNPGSYYYVQSPIEITRDLDWVRVEASVDYTGYEHTLAINNDGTLWTWGSNGHGELGKLPIDEMRYVPAKVNNDTNWTSISAGVRNSFAIKSDGTMWAWGANYIGQLGIGTGNNVSEPTQVINTGEVVSASITPAASNFDLFVAADIQTSITWNSANSITGVYIGADQLTPGTDYIMEGNTLTIKKEYITGLHLTEGDSAAVDIFFNLGSKATLTINIISTAPPPEGQWFIRRENPPGLHALYAVCYGNNTFVAVGAKGTIAKSSNGADWADVLPKSTLNDLSGIAYGNGAYVAVGAYGKTLYSNDATTWWTVGNAYDDYLYGIAYGNNRFVAVGYRGAIVTSTDGRTWTMATSGTTKNIQEVTFGNGKFVAVGNDGMVLTSTDGTTWTYQASGVPASIPIEAVTYGNSQFVAGGSFGITTSADGENWIRRTYADNTYSSVAYGNNHYVATVDNGSSSGTGTIFGSDDGIIWTEEIIPPAGKVRLHSSAFGNNTFVAVGANGIILQSPVISSLPPPVVDVEIVPAAANFDIYVPADIETAITWNSAHSITDVVYGSEHLVLGADYTVSGNILTIKKEYISGLSFVAGDSPSFDISFDAGAPTSLTINILNSEPPPTPVVSAVITPGAISFDLNTPADIAATITWNSAKSVTGVVYGSQHLTSGVDYTVSNDVLNIKKEYISGLNLAAGDSVNFQITFNLGEKSIMSVTAINSYIASGNADLTSLTLSTGTLTPIFSSDTTNYSISVSNAVYGITVTPFTADINSTVKVNNQTVLSGHASQEIILNEGSNTINIVVTAENLTTKTYTIAINRAAPEPIETGNPGDSINNDRYNNYYVQDQYIKAETNGVTIDLTKGSTRLSLAQMLNLSKQNKDKPIVLTGENYTITMPRGAIDPETVKSDYDFGIKLNSGTNYDKIKESAGNSLVLTVSCNQSGKLPAGAVIKLMIGSRFAGKVLHYYYFNPEKREPGYINSVLADENGIVIVMPSSFSDYVFTLKKLDSENIVVTNPFTDTRFFTDTTVPYYIQDDMEILIKFSALIDSNLHFVGDQSQEYLIRDNSKKITDTESHWAEKEIDFVTARDLFSGTRVSIFSPDVPMTRGMVVTVLGKLWGVNPNDFGISRFNDVAAGNYYSPYVEWAAQNNIIVGTGDNQFAPERLITREEMAVIIGKFVSFAGLQLKNTSLSLSDFEDFETITSWAKESVATLQKAGIITGKGNNIFDPKRTTTRAEFAAIMKNLIVNTLNK